MYSEGNEQQNKKTTYRLGTNICKWSDQLRVNVQNKQTAHTTQYQKNKQTDPKMGRRPE